MGNGRSVVFTDLSKHFLNSPFWFKLPHSYTRFELESIKGTDSVCQENAMLCLWFTDGCSLSLSINNNVRK